MWTFKESLYLLEEGFKCIGTCLLQLRVDMTTEMRRNLKQGSVMVHEAAAELKRMFRQ